jgi:mannitol/fructose-specific phosphotransferase system IIA component (Ntr-type)
MLADLAIPSLITQSLSDFTQPGLILPALKQSDTAGVINDLSQALQRQGAIPDMLPFYHAALNQELMTSSAHENAMAFPHARLSGIRQVQFAMGRSPEPILWGPRGQSWPVHFVFLLAVPATDSATYLHLLASLARMAQQPEPVAELRRAADADSIFRLFQTLRLKPN